MDKRTRITVIGLFVAIIVTVIGVGMFIKDKMTPTKETMPLTEYYEVKDSEVMLILQDKIYENRGLMIDNTVYIDYETVVDKFNHRFYWDSKENVLTYTTPTEIFRAEAASGEYTITKTLNSTNVKSEYEIVKVFADKVYLALDFVGKHSDMTYQIYKEPNRVVINYLWGEYLYTEVTKDTQLRVEPSIKSSILMELPLGTLMHVDRDEAPQKGFTRVMTEDGIFGYVKDKHVKKSYYDKLESTFTPLEYTDQTRQDTINLVFHQIFNRDAAGSLEALIKASKKVNVVSPTWFDILDTEGNISSLASHAYVEKAQSLGLEVWGLVGDVNIRIDMEELLSRTSARDKLSNTLIQAALEYKLNGINIDFETISSNAEGKHFIQFLRELSTKCRNNGLVLSVDNYVPAPYNRYYDLEEQGKIADYIIIMAYNEFTGSDGIGPVSSLGFVKDAIQNTLEKVPEKKTIIAIPFYTKLWKEARDGSITSENLAMTRAAQVFTDNNIEKEWDANYGYHYGEYEKDGSIYRIWLEDDKSIEEKMKAIYDAKTGGVAAWKLGLEKESIWDVVIKYLN